MRGWHYQSLLLFGIFLAGCQSSLPSHRASSFDSINIGVGEDYPRQRRTRAAVDADLAVMKEAHCSVLRVGFSWAEIEPERGRFEWQFWDMLVDECIAHGVHVLPYLCYTPTWAAAETGADSWRSPPRDPTDFARFASTAAARYRGKVESWELWNEPDNPEYWRGTIAQYADLVRAGSAAIRAADPSTKIVLGGIAWNTSFVEQLLRDQHLSSAVDVINVHCYFETWSADPLERLPEYIGRIQDAITRYGDHQAIWLAEVGYSSFRRDERISSIYAARFNSEHTPDGQAAALFKALALIRAAGNIRLITWYRINDLSPTQDVIGDVNNCYLGLIDIRGHPKPALFALETFQSLLGGRIRCMDRDLLATKTLASDAEVHAFERDDGSVVILAWLRWNTPGFLPPGGVDHRNERVDVMLCGRDRVAGSEDETGNRLGGVTGRVTGRVTWVDIHLVGDHVRVVRVCQTHFIPKVFGNRG